MQATTSLRRDTRMVDNEPGRVLGELALRKTTRRIGASPFQGRLCR